MREVRLKFKHGSADEIIKNSPHINELNDIYYFVNKATDIARSLNFKGIEAIESLLKEKEGRGHQADPLIHEAFLLFFGAKNQDEYYLRQILKRLKRTYDRLSNKTITVRLLPQSKASSKYTNGSNNGAFLSPNKFTLYPRWFNKDITEASVIIIHELLHDWFLDHKIKTADGKKLTVYGFDRAVILALESPRKARRSPENYEQFCLYLK